MRLGYCSLGVMLLALCTCAPKRSYDFSFESIEEQIRVGRTTGRELIAMIGNPTSNTERGPFDILIWSHVVDKYGDTPIVPSRKRELLAYMDTSGVIQAYEYYTDINTPPIQRKIGLIFDDWNLSNEAEHEAVVKLLFNPHVRKRYSTRHRIFKPLEEPGQLWEAEEDRPEWKETVYDEHKREPGDERAASTSQSEESTQSSEMEENQAKTEDQDGPEDEPVELGSVWENENTWPSDGKPKDDSTEEDKMEDSDSGAEQDAQQPASEAEANRNETEAEPNADPKMEPTTANGLREDEQPADMDSTNNPPPMDSIPRIVEPIQGIKDGFRIAPWGMSMEQVINLERETLEERKPSHLFYPVILETRPVKACYTFVNDQLSAGSYLKKDKLVDLRDFISHFHRVRTLYEKKYGPPNAELYEHLVDGMLEANLRVLDPAVDAVHQVLVWQGVNTTITMGIVNLRKQLYFMVYQNHFERDENAFPDL